MSFMVDLNNEVAISKASNFEVLIANAAIKGL